MNLNLNTNLNSVIHDNHNINVLYIMENNKSCVLQWTGHAEYITERFSGLLARQALVDVTLICEEQKLRVHKLVLASNSVYFEEILGQDLGEEPVIILKDLNFEILKAIVEFMYCGETTISQEHLPSLLSAANIFKVKNLESAIGAVAEIPVSSEIERTSDYDVEMAINSLDSQVIEISIIDNDLEPEVEHTLYGDSGVRMNDKQEADNVVPGKNSLQCKDKNTKTVSNEQCYGFPNINENEQTSISIVQSRVQSNFNDPSENSNNRIDVPNKVGKCIKVYSHKKRQATNKVGIDLTSSRKELSNSISTECIDLLDEPSNNKVPVTFLTTLDMESADYILSLSNENIQSILGCTLSDQHTFIRYDEKSNNSINFNKNCTLTKLEKKSENQNLSIVNKVLDCVKPVLRRSTRLNQQDSEEHGNCKPTRSTLTEKKHFKKSNLKYKTEVSLRSRRKIKESNCVVADENTVQSNRHNINNSRQKKLSRLIAKKARMNAGSKEKSETKSKTCNKKKFDLPKKISEPLDLYPVIAPKLNTVACINRSLWGDMSDVLEATENGMNFSEYTPNGEIPFAVGLLPLRTALERMQATPEYQPRKTRSSVALVKQDVNYLKRKTLNCIDSNTNFKKIRNDHRDDGNANTVCHLQIRTAHCAKNGKSPAKHLSELQTEAVSNKE